MTANPRAWAPINKHCQLGRGEQILNPTNPLIRKTLYTENTKQTILVHRVECLGEIKLQHQCWHTALMAALY